MIYTVTFNPSLDYMVTVDDFKLGYTNRSTSEEMFAGGKGINVSWVLRNLGHNSVALGFMAGFVGEEIKNTLKKAEVQSDFITLTQGNSRINVKLKSHDGTEINGQGPAISEKDVEAFFAQLKAMNKGDILVLAGSVPPSLRKDIYMDILETVTCERVVVDATGDLLVNTLKHKPFLIKPNKHELEEIFHVEMKNKEDLITHGKKLQEQGARNVLISLGGDGALLLDENGKSYRANTPKGKLISAVGSGDSMVAGFLAGYLEKKDYEYAFKKAIATGSGSAFSEHFATKELVEELLFTMP